MQWFGGRFGLTALAVAATLVLMAAAPVLAQFRFGPSGRGGSFDPFFSPFGPRRPPPPERPVDYSHAPPPRKLDNPPNASVLIMGDSMADWLAYGLEDALGDTPDLAVVRKNRALSGLLRYDARNESLDWAGVAREAIAETKPKFVVMMLGINDRQPIREAVTAQTAQPGKPPAAQAKPATKEAADAEREDDEKPKAAPETKGGKDASRTYEFRTDEWALAYSRRIDATIAALKSGGVPVFWVGLPALRGSRSTGDMEYLDELYRSRVEKAGLTYIDVWDGFVDENGRFTTSGPDFEGQIRRLRTSDGVHFTKAGARKLAHYLERELQRINLPGSEPIALPQSEPQVATPTAKPSGAMPRPLAGPVVPLTAPVQGAQDLVGSGDAALAGAPRSVVRVLINGEAPAVAAGRADDFKWPRRGIAPLGADPVVATTTEPIPVMKPPPEKTVAAPAEESRPAAPPQRRATTTARAPAPPPPRGPGFSFFPFFR